jgi:hypothetical protein
MTVFTSGIKDIIPSDGPKLYVNKLYYIIKNNKITNLMSFENPKDTIGVWDIKILINLNISINLCITFYIIYRISNKLFRL